MSVNLHDLPPRATDEDAPHLVADDAWQKLQDYLKLITIQDDGGTTSKAEETANGLVIKRA
jgi:hypothetical protein